MNALDPELLELFLPEALGHLGAIASGDPAARIHAVRALKNACALVGLDELVAEVQALEEQIRAGARGAEEQGRIARSLEALASPAGAGSATASEWDPDELRGLRAFFLDEATEQLDAVTKELALLRADGRDPDALGAVLRRLHTFKGSAGSVELPVLAEAAHALESRLVALRHDGAAIDGAALTQLEDAVSALVVELARIEVEVRGRATPAQALDAEAERRAQDRRVLDRRGYADAQTIRVEVERIDELMNAASELVFDRTRIQRRALELEACLRELAGVRDALQNSPPELAALQGVVAQLSRLVQGATEDAEGLAHTSATLQEGIRRVRMMAVGRLFARLDQPMRELARKEGKQVRVVTAGEETEIDKTVVERVAEPLLHLLRNAIAHGIEPPEVRRAFGKPAEGTLSLTARHEGDSVQITVADDGQGIDVAAVRRALVDAQRLAPEEAALLDEATLYTALFEPGLSTRRGADDLAGRGVGLDAVKEAIARLGGTVKVTSTRGQGASFTVQLPLTMAVQQAFLFKVGGQVYAVPAARVQEALQVGPEDLRLGPTSDRLALPGSGREILLLRLGALLGVPPPPGTSKRSALVLTAGDETFAITCDKIIGPREIVVRSLGPLLAALPLFAGATISGAGKVQLLLDVEQLAGRARHGVQTPRPARALGPRRVLVVDDSRAIRETAQLILAQGGYATEAVPDGWDAWERLQDRPFDVLVTDVEMPRLDGHELIAKVRRSPDLRDLPVVVVSSRTGETARARVREAGADGFVPKPLRRKALLDEIEAALSRRRSH